MRVPNKEKTIVSSVGKYRLILRKKINAIRRTLQHPESMRNEAGARYVQYKALRTARVHNDSTVYCVDPVLSHVKVVIN